MKRIVLISVLILTALFSSAHAVELDDLPKEQASRITTNTATDMASCSAFFLHVSQCMNNTEPDSGSGFEQRSEQSLQMAAVLLRIANTLTFQADEKDFDEQKLWKKTQETVFLWFKRDHAEMLDEMMTCSNISLISTKHLDPCIAWFDDPDVFMQKWIDELASE